MQRLCLLRVSICRVCGSGLFFLLGRRGVAFWPSRPLLEVIAIHQLRLLCLWRHRGGGNGFKWQPQPCMVCLRARYLIRIPCNLAKAASEAQGRGGRKGAAKFPQTAPIYPPGLILPDLQILSTGPRGSRARVSATSLLFALGIFVRGGYRPNRPLAAGERRRGVISLR